VTIDISNFTSSASELLHMIRSLSDEIALLLSVSKDSLTVSNISDSLGINPASNGLAGILTLFKALIDCLISANLSASVAANT
jgi:hypothetical protein